MMIGRHGIGGFLLAAIGMTTSPFSLGEEAPGAVNFDDSEIVSLAHPSWFKTSFMDLRDDMEDARDGGKIGLMLYFASEGCAYCKAFVQHTLADPEVQTELREGFDVIGLDMFSDVEITDFKGDPMPMKKFASGEGAAVSPTLVFYGIDGERLLRIQGYYPPARFGVVLDFLVGGHFATDGLRGFAAKRTPQDSHQTAAPQADPLFELPPYALDRSRVPAQRPLLVLFEGGECAECPHLRSHVLPHPPVRQLLAQYDVIRFDWSDGVTPLVTPGGERSNPVSWAGQLGVAQVPAIVFFNEAGQEVFRLESLVLRQRMERALLYVLEKAYEQGMTYQQFTRAKTIEKLKAAGASAAAGG